MKESSYLTLLGKFEHSDSWGFGDAFELLCFHTRILANAFDSGRDGFEKIDTALRDVWTTIEDSISDGKIRVKSGKLSALSAGPMFTENSNVVVIDKKSFLSWYRRDKEKIVRYLFCAGLKIHHEEFLDNLPIFDSKSELILNLLEFDLIKSIIFFNFVIPPISIGFRINTSAH